MANFMGKHIRQNQIRAGCEHTTKMVAVLLHHRNAPSRQRNTFGTDEATDPQNKLMVHTKCLTVLANITTKHVSA